MEIQKARQVNELFTKLESLQLVKFEIEKAIKEQERFINSKNSEALYLCRKTSIDTYVPLYNISDSFNKEFLHFISEQINKIKEEIDKL